MTIDLVGGKLHSSFKVGDTGDPMTPRKVTWVKPTHCLSGDTGLRAPAAFDPLYDAGGGCLHGLRPADLGPVGANGGVVRHVLRLERRDPHPPAGEDPAERRRQQALAHRGTGALNHQHFSRHGPPRAGGERR